MLLLSVFCYMNVTDDAFDEQISVDILKYKLFVILYLGIRIQFTYSNFSASKI